MERILLREKSLNERIDNLSQRLKKDESIQLYLGEIEKGNSELINKDEAYEKCISEDEFYEKALNKKEKCSEEKLYFEDEYNLYNVESNSTSYSFEGDSTYNPTKESSVEEGTYYNKTMDYNLNTCDCDNTKYGNKVDFNIGYFKYLLFLLTGKINTKEIDHYFKEYDSNYYYLFAIHNKTLSSEHKINLSHLNVLIKKTEDIVNSIKKPKLFKEKLNSSPKIFLYTIYLFSEIYKKNKFLDTKSRRIINIKNDALLYYLCKEVKDLNNNEQLLHIVKMADKELMILLSKLSKNELSEIMKILETPLNINEISKMKQYIKEVKPHNFKINIKTNDKELKATNYNSLDFISVMCQTLEIVLDNNAFVSSKELIFLNH